MYNGIGLTTARGSGTNGYVQRNISAIRKTKEKVPDYHEKEDTAVRAYDPELVEHDRRRQAEVRCMELRDLLEEQKLSEFEIEKKVNDFRNKLLAEKKLTYQRDSSGRPIVKDSHEFSVAQEQKNTRAKDAFGIREDFIPGQSMEGKKFAENMPKELQDKPDLEAVSTSISSAVMKEKLPEKAKKRKKSHKRSKRSSSSSGSSSEEESHRKKRKKEKKKKSKKSHRHRTDSSSKRSHKNSDKKGSDNEQVDKNRNIAKSAPVSATSTCCISIATSESSSDSEHSQAKHFSDVEENGNLKYSLSGLSVVDFSGHHKYYPPSLSNVAPSNGKLSPVEAFQRACIPLLASVITPCQVNGSPAINHRHHSDGSSRSSSSESRYSTRSRSSSIARHSKSPSRSCARSRSRTPMSRSHRSVSSRSKSKSEKSRSRSRSISSRSRSRSKSRGRSHSLSSRSHSHSSHSSKHSSSRSRSQSLTTGSRRSESKSPKSDRSKKSRSPSIPRRRGSPSFMERRRITSARKRPYKYKRKDAVEWNISSSSDSD